jgi:hypothetical protein
MRSTRTEADKATAYHEAGHAVMAFQLGVEVRQITIVPDRDSAGSCSHEKLLKFRGTELCASPAARVRIEKLIMICLAGPLAQSKFKPRSVRRYHGTSDYSLIADVALQLNGSAEAATAFVKWLEVRTTTMLRQQVIWRFVEAVANELIAKRELEGSTLLDLRAKSIREC